MHKIDILMATYNGDKFIAEQIRSIKTQSYSDWKLYIRDDGSTDSTIKIINNERLGWEEKIVTIESEKELEGISGNFYELLKQSRSNYIVFSDQDDVWFQDKLLHLYHRIKLEESLNDFDIPILLHSNLVKVDSSLNKIPRPFFNLSNTLRSAEKQLLVQNVVTGCTMMINKALKELVVPFNNKILMHDWWIAIIASFMGKIVYMDEPLIFYRHHATNSVGVTSSFIKELKKEIKRVVYPRKYNKYLMLLEQAKVVKVHLQNKGASELELEVLDIFIKISNYPKFKFIFFMILKGYTKFPFFRNLYLLSTK